LFEQFFHRSPVIGLHARGATFPRLYALCGTGPAASHTDRLLGGDETEDISICYADAFVYIDRNGFFAARRNQTPAVPEDSCKKWALRGYDRDTLKDALSCGARPSLG
jgi:hypothetical protein